MHLALIKVVAMFPPGRPGPWDVSVASPVRMLIPAKARSKLPGDRRGRVAAQGRTDAFANLRPVLFRLDQLPAMDIAQNIEGSLLAGC
jgi:hypothetical protein